MASSNEIKRRKHERFRRREMERQAHRAAKRRYAEALQRVLTALGIPDRLHSLPESMRSGLLEFRPHSIRIKPAEGTKVPRRVLEFLQECVSHEIKCSMVEIIPGGGKVSIEDFFTAGLALSSYATTGTKKDKPEAVRAFCTQLVPLSQNMLNPDSEAAAKVMMIGQVACTCVSRINQSMYYLMPGKHAVHSSGLEYLSIAFNVHQAKPEARKIVFEGKSRPAWRIGWPQVCEGVQWCTLTARDLGVDSALADLPMNVCIQSHALIRLMERVDTLDQMAQHVSIFYACLRKDVVPLPDNRALVAFHVFAKKLGYFLAEIVAGVVVFRTFLFITNSGTPEGDRLNHELRVGKIEKEFLHIDTLSAFVRTDMTLDSRVADVFKRVGLGHLCDLDPVCFGKRSPLATGYAADFVKYMGLG